MLLLILLLLVFFGWGGWFGGNLWNPGRGPGISLGTIVVILLICWLLGAFGGGFGYMHRVW
jgi:hypothetical protein